MHPSTLLQPLKMNSTLSSSGLPLNRMDMTIPLRPTAIMLPAREEGVCRRVNTPTIVPHSTQRNGDWKLGLT